MSKNHIDVKLEELNTKIDDLLFLQKIQNAEMKHIAKEIRKVETLDNRVQRVENTAAFAKGFIAFIALCVGSIITYLLR